jgi:hypothetical protein
LLGRKQRRHVRQHIPQVKILEAGIHVLFDLSELILSKEINVVSCSSFILWRRYPIHDASRIATSKKQEEWDDNQIDTATILSAHESPLERTVRSGISRPRGSG